MGPPGHHEGRSPQAARAWTPWSLREHTCRGAMRICQLHALPAACQSTKESCRAVKRGVGRLLRMSYGESKQCCQRAFAFRSAASYNVLRVAFTCRRGHFCHPPLTFTMPAILTPAAAPGMILNVPVSHMVARGAGVLTRRQWGAWGGRLTQRTAWRPASGSAVSAAAAPKQHSRATRPQTHASAGRPLLAWSPGPARKQAHPHKQTSQQVTGRKCAANTFTDTSICRTITLV